MPLLVRSFFDTLRRAQAERQDQAEVREQSRQFRAKARNLDFAGLVGDLFPLGRSYERERLEDTRLRPPTFAEMVREQPLAQRQLEAFQTPVPQPEPAQATLPPPQSLAGVAIGLPPASRPLPSPVEEPTPAPLTLRQMGEGIELPEKRRNRILLLDYFEPLKEPLLTGLEREGIDLEEFLSTKSGLGMIRTIFPDADPFEIAEELGFEIFRGREADLVDGEVVLTGNDEIQLPRFARKDSGGGRRFGTGLLSDPSSAIGGGLPPLPENLSIPTGDPAALAPFVQPVSEEVGLGQAIEENVPIAGGPLRRSAAVLSTPITAAALPLVGPAELAAGEVGAVALGSIGEALDAPPLVQGGLELAGGLTPAGLLRSPLRAGARAAPQPSDIAKLAPVEPGAAPVRAVPEARPAAIEVGQVPIGERVRPVGAERDATITGRDNRGTFLQFDNGRKIAIDNDGNVLPAGTSPAPARRVAPGAAPAVRQAAPAPPVTTVAIPPPPGGSQGRPLVPGGSAPSVDMWRSIERGNITGEQAQDLGRQIADKLGDYPVTRAVQNVTAGPAASAGTDVTTRAGVVNKMMEQVTNNERTVRMAGLRRSFPFQAAEKGQVQLANGRVAAMGDVAEDFLAGGQKFGQLAAEEQAFIREGKKFIDDLAAQYGAQTGQNIATRGEFFWPRVVLDDAGKTGFRAGVGSKQTPFKGRILEEMEFGVEVGVDYADPLTTLDHYAKSLQKATRDDIFKKVILEDEVGRIIDAKGLMDREVVDALNAARDNMRAVQRRVLNQRTLAVRARSQAGQDIGSLRGKLRREREALARLQGAAGAPRRQAPLSMGREIAKRETAIADLQNQIDELSKAAKGIPRIRLGRPQQAKALTPGLAATQGAAKARLTAAARQYTRELNKARSRAMTGGRGETSGISLGPGLGNVIFDRAELAKLQAISTRSSRALGIAESISAVPRFIITGAIDVGHMSIQMALLAARRPHRWAQAVAGGFRDMAQPKNFLRYLSEDRAVQRVAPFGVDVGGSEFTEAVRTGLLSRIPVVSPLLRIAPRGFDSMLARARILDADALIGAARTAGDPEDSFFRIGRYVNTKMGATHTASLGISAPQRQLENAFGFFSARYTRSIPGTVGYLFSKGVPAKDARESLALLLLGASGTFYATAKAMGMDDKEILERLNPRSGGRFMSLPIAGNEYGFGSGWRSYIRFLGDLASEDSWEFDSWSDAAQNNPMVRFLRSRTSPLTGTLLDFITGEDFLGRSVSVDEFIDSPELLLDYIQDSFSPLNIEAIIEARGSIGAKIGAGAVETVGGRAFPRSPFTLLEEAQEAEFQARKGAGEQPFRDFSSYEELKTNNSAAASIIDQSQRVVQAQERLDVESRFRSTEETRGFETAEQFRTESTAAQEQDDERLATFFRTGTGLEPKDWQGEQANRQRSLFAAREGIFAQAGIEFEDREAPAGSVNEAIQNYFSVDIEDFTNNLTREVDWAGFASAKERALRRLSPRDRRDVDDFIHQYETDTERAFRKLQVELGPYFDIDSEAPGASRARENLRRRTPRLDAILWITGITGVESVFPSGVRQAQKILREELGINAGRGDIPIRQPGGGGVGRSPGSPIGRSLGEPVGRPIGR